MFHVKRSGGLERQTGKDVSRETLGSLE